MIRFLRKISFFHILCAHACICALLMNYGGDCKTGGNKKTVLEKFEEENIIVIIKKL